MNRFDRLADRVANAAASPYFFSACVLLVIIWLPSFLIMPEQVPGKVDTWQLVINTATTIITFLMVALLHNDQQRFEKATNQRLERIIEAVCGHDPVEDEGQKT
ncbi:MAG TPA: low affinity iron permease family protein [Gemmatimonadales bacterium]|nr:low affinity iron permease family protein [Gemmatimonadales bacterium]